MILINDPDAARHPRGEVNMTFKILLVDDNSEFRKMIGDYLVKKRPNLEVFEACTGEMGVAKASFVDPDIVLMDINLPRANGFESARQIREDHPRSDVIVVTMFDVEEFHNVFESLGAFAFIGKSEIYDRLLPEIDRCLEKRGMLSEDSKKH